MASHPPSNVLDLSHIPDDGTAGDEDMQEVLESSRREYLSEQRRAYDTAQSSNYTIDAGHFADGSCGNDDDTNMLQALHASRIAYLKKRENSSMSMPSKKYEAQEMYNDVNKNDEDEEDDEEDLYEVLVASRASFIAEQKEALDATRKPAPKIHLADTIAEGNEEAAEETPACAVEEPSKVVNDVGSSKRKRESNEDEEEMRLKKAKRLRTDIDHDDDTQPAAASDKPPAMEKVTDDAAVGDAGPKANSLILEDVEDPQTPSTPPNPHLEEALANAELEVPERTETSTADVAPLVTPGEATQKYFVTPDTLIATRDDPPSFSLETGISKIRLEPPRDEVPQDSAYTATEDAGVDKVDTTIPDIPVMEEKEKDELVVELDALPEEDLATCVEPATTPATRRRGTWTKCFAMFALFLFLVYGILYILDQIVLYWPEELYITVEFP